MSTVPSLGDRVAFSSHFLRSMAEPATSPRWGDRGYVSGLTDAAPLVEVTWDHGAKSIANISNLRCVERGAGLVEETAGALGNAWVGMGFIKKGLSQ